MTMASTRIPVVEPSNDAVERYCVAQQYMGTFYIQYVGEDGRQQIAISEPQQYENGPQAYWAAWAVAEPGWTEDFFFRIIEWHEHDGVLDVQFRYNFYSNTGLLEEPPRDETAEMWHRFVPLPLCDPGVFVLTPPKDPNDLMKN